MIEKMTFLNLTGPCDDIDRVVDRYLSHYSFHLENALTELADVRTLEPFRDQNPYRDVLARIDGVKELMPADLAVSAEMEAPAIPETMAMLDALDASLAEDREAQEKAREKLAELEEHLQVFSHFRDLPEDVAKILKYHFVDFRFGSFRTDDYLKFMNFVYNDFDTFFYKCGEDDRYVYGVSFSPLREVHQIDAVYSSMHFERIYIPDGYSGTPEEIIAQLEKDVAAAKAEIAGLDAHMRETAARDAPALMAAKERFTRLSGHFDVREKAAIVKAKDDTFYILCGWMTAPDAERFMKEIEGDPYVVCVDQDASQASSVPPTKLKNPRLFKPYEMYVEMYGLPNYKEIDPTVFVAVTYSFIFGAMFGDFGQGLCLLIAGFLLYHFKHIKLAGIIACAGFFSSIFGILFGSFFGFEDTVIKHVWLKPKEATMYVPGIGNINTVLVCAIVFGMLLILSTMVFNILNSRRLGDKEGELFGTNSLVGFVFYTGVIIAVLRLFGPSGKGVPTWFVLVFIVLPLVIMFLKEPLTKAVLRRTARAEVAAVANAGAGAAVSGAAKTAATAAGAAGSAGVAAAAGAAEAAVDASVDVSVNVDVELTDAGGISEEKEKGESPVMFFVQSFFEMFETLLSFFSNTLSFVRIGAFAVSHAAMMEVVLMLAGAASGKPNWIAVVLGNLFVMGMEGLIVGIQVLRLEYYEMFSRFYKGDGKPFVPFE